MKIIFTSDYTVDDQKKTEYKQGQIIDCSHSTCEHFRRKGVADIYKPTTTIEVEDNPFSGKGKEIAQAINEAIGKGKKKQKKSGSSSHQDQA